MSRHARLFRGAFQNRANEIPRSVTKGLAMRKKPLWRYTSSIAALYVAIQTAEFLAAPCAYADNARLNNGVVANVYTVQRQNGCPVPIRVNPQLQLAAQWHTDDLLNNRMLDGDTGTDGSSSQGRANAAGFHGRAVETLAIRSALAINGLDLINQWYHGPASYAIMSDCANSAIGVWSGNRLDRSVVVAVYGQPA